MVWHWQEKSVFCQQRYVKCHNTHCDHHSPSPPPTHTHTPQRKKCCARIQHWYCESMVLCRLCLLTHRLCQSHFHLPCPSQASNLLWTRHSVKFLDEVIPLCYHPMWHRSSRSFFLTSDSRSWPLWRRGRLKLKDVCRPLVLVPLIFSCLKSSAILYLKSSVPWSSFR